MLPFDNMAGDPEQEYFADGMVEDIIAALSRIRSFFVIARNSASPTRAGPSTCARSAASWACAMCSRAACRRRATGCASPCSSIETEGGAHVWADRVDGALEDVFDLQDRITERVAGALEPSIRLAEIERARRKRPQDLGAYDYTMRAMPHVWVLEKDEASAALELLGQGAGDRSRISAGAGARRLVPCPALGLQLGRGHRDGARQALSHAERRPNWAAMIR